MSISVGNTTHSSVASGSSLTVSHNNDSNTVFVSVLSADGGGGKLVTSCTYGGVAMTQLWDFTGEFYFHCAGFILTGAPGGANNVAVTLAGAQGAGLIVHAVSLSGVNQASPTRAPSTAADNVDQTPSIAPASSAGDLIIGNVVMYSTTLTSGGSQTQECYDSNVAALISGSTDVAPAGTTLSWTGNGGGQTKSLAGAVALIPAPAAALAGTASVDVSASGSLLTAIQLSGTGNASISASGDLSTGIVLQGAAAMSVVAAGSLATIEVFSGTAEISVSAQGSLTTGSADQNPRSFMWPRTVSVSRPTTQAVVGPVGYSGLTSTQLRPVLGNVGCSIQMSRTAAKPSVGLPGDAIDRTLWRVIIPRSRVAKGTIRDHDVLVDDEGYRYQVTAAYWNSLGYSLLAERLES